MNSLGKVGQTLRPGQHGTRRHSQRYGDQLLPVRYRYDPKRQVRRTTVELLVEETCWMPPAEEIVFVRVEYDEVDLRNRLKTAGARWNPELRRWETTKATARKLKLENRLDSTSLDH